MLTDGKVIGFVPTTDSVRARAFYEKQLGLTFVSEDPFALVFDANGTTIRVVRVASYMPAPFTILGWNVKNIRECAMQLQRNGIEFQRFPGLGQDDEGVWAAPGGARVAWFRDPDGNMLSISEG
jgi:catechol 2,3-dioxygenase-like lactoylglutathione lyase family enzyme